MTIRLSTWVQKVSSLAGILEYREDKFIFVTRCKLNGKKPPQKQNKPEKQSILMSDSVFTLLQLRPEFGSLCVDISMNNLLNLLES